MAFVGTGGGSERMPASGLSRSDGGGRAGPCGAGKQRTQGAIPTSIRYRVQTIIDLMVRLTEAGCELRVAPARLRLRSGALRIAADIYLIDHILPWIVLLLGLSLPSLAVWLLG